MSAANQQQRDAWNGDSGQRWVADADRRDEVLVPVAEALLAAAGLHAGQSVLDIGCGCGATTLAAADAVLPGRVVGLDLSAPMLNVARHRAHDRSGVEFVHGDAQTDPLEPTLFDVAISRFGTMFFDDPTAAFANVRRGMRAGGALCIATWQPLGANEWLLVPGAILLRYGSLPETPPGAPGMFAQSEPAAVASVLEAAGWHEVQVQPVTVRLRLGADADEATDYLADIGLARALLDGMDATRRADAIAAVRDELAGHQDDAGVCLDAGIHIITASAAR